jgi:hypothetical protein
MGVMIHDATGLFRLFHYLEQSAGARFALWIVLIDQAQSFPGVIGEFRPARQVGEPRPPAGGDNAQA